ncbi:MAG: ABC transporter permease subunit [Methylococcales bacterium]|jgi:phosphate transport system permease protein|nr:ABC transporter permease subunit [Methylococcales bacterium]MBT7410040.1 ABC transporter permease subunit [Methylococcales bacterium]
MNNSLPTKHYDTRSIKEQAAKYFVTLGGVSVIAAILLIFFYLLQVVIPMFSASHIKELTSYHSPVVDNAELSSSSAQKKIIPLRDKTLVIGLEEQGMIGARVTASGKVIFFNTTTGQVTSTQSLDIESAITSYSSHLDLVVLGLANGHARVLKIIYEVSYQNNVRTLTPKLKFPLGEESIELDPSGQALTQVVLQLNDDSAGLAAVTNDQRLVVSHYIREESFIDESFTTELESRSEKTIKSEVVKLALAPALDHLYVATQGDILYDYSLNDEGFVNVPAKYTFKHPITSIKLLLGGNSLLVGLHNGEVQQWMQVRTKNGSFLTFIRNFQENNQAVSVIATEHGRKGFAVSDNHGHLTLFYSTSQRTVASIEKLDSAITHMAWSSRAQHLLVVDDQQIMHLYHVDNEYPEVSWDVLFGKIWYEGYDEPDYIWQSSASTNDFEPKFSLVPLTFGTIKAAFYAMLFAIPIALLGAMFTAQFMAPRMRQTVKPTIEIMEALPTVILGFLAGLWLAPYVETHLAGVFTLFIILPFGFILSAFVWEKLPNKAIFEGWEAAILIPVILLMVWLSMTLSSPLENLLFNGSLRDYMSQQWGWGYDQRNSLVVGLIMGFAVIPTIFSIAEDALFSVPQHLIRGSLALGASRWQTMMYVVLPAASPAIFSAVMMGFGRAVGETMIVLMATGNTPLMDMSIFQGMRTLAANIAVEVPEAEVASTHYRILFLAAFILFSFTFIFNTIAELIRHRLRQRYSEL